MRVFAALYPPAEALRHAEMAVAPLRQSVPSLRWVPGERWHVTLAFYGEVADREVPRLQRRLHRAASASAPLRLRLTGAGAFARRAVWLGLDGNLDGLRSLAAAVAMQPGPYRAHLTVARLRGSADPTAAVDVLSAYDGPQWVAEEVTLVRSHLGPSPTHEPLSRFRLSGPDPAHA